MPIRTVEGIDLRYHLITFDESGTERPDPDGSMPSADVRRIVSDANEQISDVFLISHGWKGDVAAAIAQYDLWAGEMARSPDRQIVSQVHPDFRPLIIGVHWPSLPFGDESIPAPSVAPARESDTDVAEAARLYAQSIADTPEARAAITENAARIVAAARNDDGRNDTLSDVVSAAYEKIFSAARLDRGDGDLGGPPGDDHWKWNPAEIIARAREREAEDTDSEEKTARGAGLFAGLKGFVVAPLQQLSFWKMKDRARQIGETGIHNLLLTLQEDAQPGTRFHLMGHSFGCIVVSAAVAGPPGGVPLKRPVDSLFLVQGALSLWAFSPKISLAGNKTGYFHCILKKGLVAGPLVTTRSVLDRAVRRLYPAAARVARQVVLDADLPKYGGIGSYGARGLAPEAADSLMLPDGHAYGFERGRVYNLEASGVIRTGGGFAGAHNDIAHPEVAHAMWEAAMVTRPPPPTIPNNTHTS